MKFFNRNKYDGIIFPKEQVKFLNKLEAMAYKEDITILDEYYGLEIYDGETDDLSEIEDHVIYLLQRDNNLTYLNIPPSNLRSIPKTLRKIQSITHIDISPLWMNTDKIFKYLPPKLRKLTIEYCYLPVIPKSIYKLSYLEELTFDDTGIEVIPDSIIELRNLKKLSILNNPIEDLPESLFSHPTLEEINIGFPAFDSIDVIEDKLHANHCLIITPDFITIKNTLLVSNSQKLNTLLDS